MVDLESGEVVCSKSRRLGGPDLIALPWSEGGGVGDMPVSFHMQLCQDEFSKLSLLGGEHWIRSRLAGVDTPAPLPVLHSSDELLAALAARELPFIIVGEQAGWAEQLRLQGLLEAEFTVEADPASDWAVVLSITPRGREALAATGPNGKMPVP